MAAVFPAVQAHPEPERRLLQMSYMMAQARRSHRLRMRRPRWPHGRRSSARLRLPSRCTLPPWTPPAWRPGLHRSSSMLAIEICATNADFVMSMCRAEGIMHHEVAGCMPCTRESQWRRGGAVPLAAFFESLR